MHEASPTAFLPESVVLLGFALVFVVVFRRLGLGATLGYLLAGAVVGPAGLGLVGDAEAKIGIAELGIVLLLFVVGLELNPARLWRMRRDILGLGLAQVLACGLAVAVLIALATPYPSAAILALALPLALSSTAQVLPMLQSSGRLRTPFGERAFSILLFQDLSIIPLITMIAALNRNPADAGSPSGWLLTLHTVIAIAGLIAAGRFVIRPLFRVIARLGEREMFVVAALFTVGASAAVMDFLGLSTALGAFVAGVMLADTPYRHELEADVEPFRSILLGLFFLAVGMMLDLGAIAERPLFVLGMAFALIAVKSAVIFTIALALRTHWRGALALGLVLSQGGEFGFVLFTQAQEALLIDGEIASLFGAIVTLSMAMSPLLVAATRHIREPAPGPGGERAGPVADGARAIVIGYGRFGQTVTQILIAGGLSVTLVDSDTEMIDVAERFGAKVYFGDGTRLDLLRQAGAANAGLILFCIDGERLNSGMLMAVKHAFPQAAIYVRAYDRRTLLRLRDAPVETAVREVLESAISMARHALGRLGVRGTEIDRAEEIYRKRDRQRLEKQLETGDMHAAHDRIITRLEGLQDE